MTKASVWRAGPSRTLSEITEPPVLTVHATPRFRREPRRHGTFHAIPVSLPCEIGDCMAGKIPPTAASVHWEQVSYSEWIITFRKLRLDAPVKCVGYALASYADWNTGNDAFPGIHELARATGYRSNHTIVDALKAMRELRLIERRVKGNREGRRGNADMYFLTLTNVLREAAGVDPCTCTPKKAAKDPWAALSRPCARGAPVLHLVDPMQNECRTVADLRQNRCRSSAPHASDAVQNRCTTCTPTKNESSTSLNPYRSTPPSARNARLGPRFAQPRFLSDHTRS